ncbi:hypothetical protein V8D89_000503 [Ganoderma adspersum]
MGSTELGWELEPGRELAPGQELELELSTGGTELGQEQEPELALMGGTEPGKGQELTELELEQEPAGDGKEEGPELAIGGSEWEQELGRGLEQDPATGGKKEGHEQGVGQELAMGDKEEPERGLRGRTGCRRMGGYWFPMAGSTNGSGLYKSMFSN